MNGSHASELVAALERAWDAIQARHPAVPEVVLVVGAGSGQRAGELKLGHFGAQRWQVEGADHHEVLIGGEGLRRGALPVLGTLLHEAAHGLAWSRGVKDTSRGGRYHNRRYRLLAEELGLTVEELPSLGWSGTAVRPETGIAYAEALAQLERAIVLWRRQEAAPEPGRPKSRNLLACRCPCGRRIRVAESTLEEAPIVCGSCGKEFAPTADSASEILDTLSPITVNS